MVQKLYEILSEKERKQFLLLVLLIVIMVFFDLAGVASIMPFVAIVANPQIIETNSAVNYIYKLFDIKDPESFRVILGVFVFVCLCVSLVIKAATTYAQQRFILMSEYGIGKRLIQGFLHQPFSWFLNRNSADLGSRVLGDVANVINSGLIPIMTMVSQGAVTLAFLSLLLYVEPNLALTIGLFLMVSYVMIYFLMSDRLSNMGAERHEANIQRWSILSEAFGGAKEIKAAGLENAFLRRFDIPAQIFARNQSIAQSIGQLPRFAMEGVVYGGMLLVVIFLTTQKGGFANAAPIISLYAFVGYRTMPAIQQIYGAFTQLRFAGPVIDALYKDFKCLIPSKVCDEPGEFKFEKIISLKNISYSYPNSEKPALTDVSLDIHANTRVGFVGSTGSGKTTIVDLILGLLKPKGGILEVDGVAIRDDNCRAWQRMIGYVPQHIFLADDTIEANIAFGVDPDDIVFESVQRAARIANLHEFVTTQLPDGYRTKIGERGIRLSGGQRQRIGIARALYHNPRVLIFDEATSALDNITEQAVIQSLNNLGNSITTLLIAHRLSTVQNCDVIFQLDSGRLLGYGTYDILKNNSSLFKKMANKEAL
jgi:ABC-type multidrug transport system fused ATPase/permease subunit